MVQTALNGKLAGGDEPEPSSSQDTAKTRSRELILLEKYFQAAADVQILGERLADHNYEYWDAVAEREYREDQDEVLSILEEDFEKKHHEEHETICQQLDHDMEEADRLCAECEAQGIDVKANRMASGDDYDASNNETDYQQIFRDSLKLIPIEVFQNAEIVRGGTPESDGGNDDVSNVVDVVSSWIKNIPEDIEKPL